MSGTAVIKNFNIILDLLMHRCSFWRRENKTKDWKIECLNPKLPRRHSSRLERHELTNGKDETELTTVWARHFYASLSPRDFKRRALIASLSFHLFFNSLNSTSFFQKSRRNRETEHRPLFGRGRAETHRVTRSRGEHDNWVNWQLTRDLMLQKWR